MQTSNAVLCCCFFIVIGYSVAAGLSEQMGVNACRPLPGVYSLRYRVLTRAQYFSSLTCAMYLYAVAGYNGVAVEEGMPRFQVAARDDDSKRVIEALKQLYRCWKALLAYETHPFAFLTLISFIERESCVQKLCNRTHMPEPWTT